MTALTPAAEGTATAGPPPSRTAVLNGRFQHLENQIHHQLVRHSITALRITLGLVFLGFGILKYFPGVSPAQTIVESTTHILFLGLIPGAVAIKLIATLECFIGVCLLANRWMRLCVWLLAFEFIGILSPVVLFPAHLFSGPHHAPTLLGQYCLKDIILVAAGLVVTATSFRGGRLTRTDLPPNVHTDLVGTAEPETRLRIVLEGLKEPEGTEALCLRHGITEGDFHLWRDAVLTAATVSLAAPVPVEPEVAAPVLTSSRSLLTVAALFALKRL